MFRVSLVCVLLTLVASHLNLPFDEWNPTLNEGNERVWDEPWMLRAAGVTHYEQMVLMIKRLNSGLPITVVALGSSIIAGDGGCFNPMDQLLEHVSHVRERSNPGRCNTTGQVHGFLGSFMHTINATWPHKDHILINLGQPASDLLNYAERWCYHGTLPTKVDLFIIEQHDGPRDAPVRLEKLYLQLMNGLTGRLPAFLFLSTTFAVEPWRTPNASVAEECLRTACQSTKCKDWKASWFVPGTSATLQHSAEDLHAAVMHTYGFSELSIRATLISAHRDRFMGLTQCELAHKFYRDAIHPTKTGVLLFADLLTKHLKDATAFTAAVSTSKNHDLHKIRMPTAPVNAGAWAVPVKRCFDVETSTGLPIDASRSMGWAYTNEMASNGQYMKPGWISNHTGDILTVSLSTVLQPRSLGNVVTLTVEFLKSYENMGVARVACISGCACQPLLIDAAEMMGRTSMESFLSTKTTQQENCVIQVTSELKSGERFKLLGLVIQTNIDDLNTHLSMEHA